MRIKVAVIQDAPVFFDKAASLDKLEALVAEQAAEGAQLVLLPESFIPGYPRGFSFGAVVGKRTSAGRELYAAYHEHSIDLSSPDLDRLETIARTNQVYLVVGITEKDPTSGSLYCSMLYLSPEVGLMAVHRKIKPTGTERLIWAEADGRSLVSCDTQIGRLGGLICWENYMPLARMSIYQQGVQIYLAPTADSREEWQATMRHIALEGRCFVLSCNQYFTKSMYPDQYQELVADEAEEMCPGGSVIISPLGKVLAGPLFGTSGALTVELDLTEVVAAKLDFDPIGHYARPDIFDFQVNGQTPIVEERNFKI